MPPPNLDLTDADREALVDFLDDPATSSDSSTGLRFVKNIKKNGGNGVRTLRACVTRKPGGQAPFKQTTRGPFATLHAALLYALETFIPSEVEAHGRENVSAVPSESSRLAAIAYLKERIQTAQAQGGATGAEAGVAGSGDAVAGGAGDKPTRADCHEAPDGPAHPAEPAAALLVGLGPTNLDLTAADREALVDFLDDPATSSDSSTGLQFVKYIKKTGGDGVRTLRACVTRKPGGQAPFKQTTKGPFPTLHAALLYLRPRDVHP